MEEQNMLQTEQGRDRSKEARPKEGTKLSIDLSDDNQEPTAFKTRHAAYIAEVLGHNDKVVEYDKLRHKLKSGARPTRTQRQTRQKLFAELQCLIRSQKTSVEQNLGEVDSMYYRQHATLPSSTSCPEYGELMK